VKTLTSTELKQSDGPTVLLDVRLEEDHKAESLPEAISCCVFEVGFLDAASSLVTDKSARVCVYGSGPDSHESRVAAEKLERAGFTDVVDLREGIAGWKAAGLDTVVGESVQLPRVEDGKRPVDLAESRVEWLGRNLLNKHWGTVALKSGVLEISDNRIMGGEFVLDMNRLECADLAGTKMHDILIAHLSNDDFFDVENHPEARLSIAKATPIEGARAGAANLELECELTLRGQTNSVIIKAVSGVTPDGKPAAQAALAIDRTRWGSIYGSGKFFHRLAGHVVNDLVEIQVRIVGE